MSATGTDSDSETVRAEGIIEGDKLDKGKEAIGKTTQAAGQSALQQQPG